MRDLLAAEIRDFRPEDEAESRHQSEILALLSRPRFASRYNFEPGHITASAFIIDRGSQRLLLHRHRRLGRWLQMGGHLDESEAPAAAALREGAEESGLRDLRLLVERIIDVDIHSIPVSASEPAHRHFDLRYLVVTSQPWEIVIDPQESSSLGWFALDQAAALMNEPCSTRAVVKIQRILNQLWSTSPTA